jgi:hypothetical protein
MFCLPSFNCGEEYPYVWLRQVAKAPSISPLACWTELDTPFPSRLRVASFSIRDAGPSWRRNLRPHPLVMTDPSNDTGSNVALLPAIRNMDHRQS